jgi:hypothetical protein
MADGNLNGIPPQVIEDVLVRVLRNSVPDITTPHAQELGSRVTDRLSDTLPAEQQPKSLVGSITVWSGVGGLLSGLAQLYMGYSTQDPQMFYTGAVSVIAGAGAIYGRVRATRIVAP